VTSLTVTRLDVCPLLDTPTLRASVDEFLALADDVTWNRYTSCDWHAAEVERLTPSQRSAVDFITAIEDHLPNYFAEYSRGFPISEDADVPSAAHNRLLYHFTVRWAQEEDRHAHALAEYQVRTGLATRDDVERRLAIEGRKRFQPPVHDALGLFTYTLIQEKATQLYYQQLANAVAEPVLRKLLRCLARDEARHFAFFSNVIGGYLARFGAACLSTIEATVREFKMPLHNTLDRYWRRALEMRAAAGGYDHLEAFDSLLRVVDRFADAATRSKTHDLRRFVEAIRAH